MNRFSKFLFILMLAAFAQFIPARAAANPELEEIRRLETLLLTPCDKPLAYMTELVRLGQTYQDQERQRLAIYRSLLDTHRLVLANFLTEKTDKAGVAAGTFRARYDQLYQEAEREGMLREASYEDIPEYQNMADMAVRVSQYDAAFDKQLHASEASVGSWSKRQENVSNKLFFVEEQRASAERLRLAMAKLREDWEKARSQYFKTMEADPYKSVYDELDKRAAFMIDTLRKEYDQNRQALTIAAQSGNYAHCLGDIVESQYHTVASNDFGFAADPVTYLAGAPGTVEALPGMGYPMKAPVVFDKIKALPTDIPEEFPLDLPLKFDPLPYIKTEIECQKIKIKAEKDAIIAMGNYLTGLDGTGALVVGETFNVFHGLCEGFGSIGNILIGLGTAPLHPIETYEKINKIKDGMVQLWESSDAKQALVEKGGQAVVDYFRGIGSAVNLLVLPDPDDGVYDRYTMEEWRKRAEETQLAREMVTNSEKLVGSILADILTGVIISKASTTAKLAAEVADTAGDLSRVKAKASKISEALTKAGKVADDVPDAKTIQHLGEQISKSQEDLLKIVDDISVPKPRDIPYNQQMLPSPDEVLAKARASTAKGGMNTYIKIDDDLGIKVTNKEILKKIDDPTASAISRAQRDLDDAGRRFLEDVTKDSPFGRLPQVKDRYYIVDDLFTGPKKYTSVDDIPNGMRYKVVDVVENIPPSTHASTLAKEGRLTENHIRAYEAFMRDMNSKGYIWTDNKLDNFAFEAVDEARGVYRVVPIDTGGIYKVGSLPQGMTSGDMARKLQLMYDRGFEVPGGSQANMLFAQLKEAQRLGIPQEILDDLPRYLGVQQINPTATDVAATWMGGVRISSPGKPYSAVYSQVSSKADDALAREAADILEARLAANPQYQAARQALEAEKAQLAEAGKKLESAERQLVEAELAAKKSAATTTSIASAKAGDTVDPLTGVAASRGAQTTQDLIGTAQKIDEAQEKILCLDIKEKLLAGIKADWIIEGWKNCQKLGFAY